MRKIIMASITAVVVIAVLAGTLIPVLDDATATTDTYTNTGAFFVEVNPTDSYTIKYDKATEAGVIYINDTAMEISFSTGYTVFAIDDAILRLQSSSNTIQYKGDGQYIVDIVTLDLTVSNGSVTGTYTKEGGTSTSWPTTTFTDAFIASPTEQDYVMTTYNTVSKMNGDSTIRAFGQTAIGPSGTPTLALVKIVGNIDDGVTVSILATTGTEISGAEVTDLQINAVADGDHKDLYDLSSITFKVTYQDVTTNAIYSAYVIPAEITAEKSVHFTDGENAIFNAIPFIVIVALLLGIVALVLRSRME